MHAAKTPRASGNTDAGPGDAKLDVDLPHNWKSPFESSLADRERFYRTLVEQTRDFMTVVDREGTILFKNRTTEHSFGYTPSELIGRNVFDFIHPEDASRVRAALDASVRGERGLAVEHRFRYKDGSWRVFESIGTYCRDFPFGPIAIVSSRDITDRKSLEAQFRQVQRLEVLGRMTSTVAHDFRNVLAAIMACADRVLEGELPPAVRRSATQLCQTAQQAQGWMHRALLFAREEAASPQAVSMNEVVIELTTFLHHLIGTNCALTLSLAAAPAWVTIDQVLLEQVIMNLVVNARDAMPSGGVITIATGNVPPARSNGPGQVVLSVTDTGVGMSDQVKKRIFEPFFSTKASDGHSGLGLTTVFSVVNQAGGHVIVETEPGGGSTFKITLPGHQGTGHDRSA